MPDTKEKITEEVFLGRDKRIVYHHINKDRVTVNLVNPTALKNVTEAQLCERLRKHIAKVEFEEWFAANLLASAMFACADHIGSVELEWLNADLYICFQGDSDWSLLTDSSTLKSALDTFDIFEVIEFTGTEINLRYI
jgi:hypothetical protein